MSFDPAVFFDLAQRSGSVREFLASALQKWLAPLQADFAAVVLVGTTPPAVLAQAGTAQSWPADLVGECLDRESAVVSGPWIGLSLSPREATGDVLLVHRAGAFGEPDRWSQDTAALVLGLRMVRRIERLQARAERAETILKIAQTWSQTREMDQLLAQMAEAATQLLAADRASIFLWDRPNRELVGRPALGIPEGELRVPDDSGVAGEVLKSGQPQRVALGEPRDPVDRRVDTALGYQTRTLLAVPLQTTKGEPLGVFEALNKSHGTFTPDDEAALVELAAHASVALENTRDRQRLIDSHRRMVDEAAGHVRLIGSSAPIEALRQTVRRVAATDLAVLVLGENGTGKEIVSQSIHYLSSRRDRPFVAVNCAAMAETLLESELFGHEKGAFTDAHEARPGKFEVAAGGTLFLDEIGDLSLGGQAKLLRVLEEKIVVRVGGSRPIAVDARVIAATNQNLAELVRGKRFREDLYFRLNVVVLELPPLRERDGDIVLLAEHFLDEFSRRAGRAVPRLTTEAQKRLVKHHWPGNVRELRNLMERIAYLSTSDRIEAAELSFILSPAAADAGLLVVDQPLSQATTRFQIEYINKALERTRGNLTEAAELLGLHRSNLYRKMKQLGLET